MKRKLFYLCIVCLAFCGLMCIGAAAKDTSCVRINGCYARCDAFASEGTTYVALREFATEALACEVLWDEGTRTASIMSRGRVVRASPDQNYLCAGERYMYDSASPICKDGKLYIPLRLAAWAFGAEAEWNYTDGCADVVGKMGIISGDEEYYDREDLYWLSRIISAESRGEPLIGQIAVGNVVLNRASSGEYPSDIYSVIFDKKHGTQFTPTANGTIYDEPSTSSIIAAKICLEGFELSDDILYFVNKDRSKSTWMDDCCEFVFKIGAHSFYA